MRDVAVVSTQPALSVPCCVIWRMIYRTSRRASRPSVQIFIIPVIFDDFVFTLAEPDEVPDIVPEGFQAVSVPFTVAPLIDFCIACAA